MSEEVKQKFILMNQIGLKQCAPVNAITLCGPEMILDEILNNPQRYASEENNTFATELENHRQEALQILAALGGLT